MEKDDGKKNVHNDTLDEKEIVQCCILNLYGIK